MINKIIVTGDVRRPLGQTTNIKTIFNLIKVPIEMVTTGVEVIEDSRNRDVISHNEWAQLFDKESGYYSNLSDFGSNVLVIGFEIPPVAVREITGCGSKVINVTLSPIRFLSDLCWNFEFYGMQGDLTQFEISEEQIKYEAGLVKAACVFMAGKELTQPTVLLVGQTLIDRSVIGDSKFLSLLDFTPQIQALCHHHHTIFKPHPHENNLLLNYPIVSDINIYKLLSDENLKTVVAVSSSVLDEAGYFGKQAIALKDTKYYEKKKHISTENFINPIFWENILRLVIKTESPAPIKLNCPRNFARKIFRAYWGMDFL